MKKLFSLVVLAGMFMLMSFSTNATNLDGSDSILKVQKDCYRLACDAADAWVDCGYGSYDESWEVYDAIMAGC